MRLRPDTDPDSLLDRLAAERPPRRLTEARAERLQRNARIRTGRWELTVGVTPTTSPATIQEGEDGSLRMTISGEQVAQPVTDLPPAVWDLLVQRVWVAHAHGHLRHSDIGDIQSRLTAIETGYRPVAAALWNALEDVAIEAAIREEWPNYAIWFAQVRTNLLAGTGPGIEDPTGGYVYPLAHAAVLAVLDGRVVDAGVLDRLRDPADDRHHFHSRDDRKRFEETVLPAVTDAAEAVLETSDPVARNRLAMSCFTTIRGAVGTADADGRGQVAARDDTWGMPADHRHEIRGEADPIEAEALRSPAPPMSESMASVSDPTDPTGAASPDGAERDDRDGSTDHEDPMGPLEAELAAETEARRRDDGEFDERAATLESLQAAVSAAESDLESDGVVLPSAPQTAHEPTAAAARADGQRLARLLRNRFQTERERTVQRNVRRGRLDPAALHRHATGDRRVFRRREEPEETSYHGLFVLDRSGSMRGHVRVAERAIGMLAVALEEVDVEVSVLELLDKEVRLAKSADRPVERVEDRLYHGDAGGGTPLTDTLHIAREYLKEVEGRRFVIVVTDGRPSSPERYRQALHRFTVPVLGVNLTTEEAAGASEFHRQVTAPPEIRQLRRALRGLVQEVLFE